VKQYLIPVVVALVLTAALYFFFSNKPPRISIFDERREKLMDSLQYPNAGDLRTMHADMQKAGGASKTALLQKLSDAWLDLGQPAIATDYLRMLADNEPGYQRYMQAGNAMRAVMDFESDEQMRVNLVYGARYCFEMAEKLQPGDIDARIGLASVLISGTSQPMEGIMMLRELDAEHPGNVAVNMELGKSSVMSGQFDKAIQRFVTVLQKDSLNLQARYLMAQTYLGLQDTVSAVRELEKLRSVSTDSTLQDQVDKEIKQLIH